jgi:hypothetical protein
LSRQADDTHLTGHAERVVLDPLDRQVNLVGGCGGDRKAPRGGAVPGLAGGPQLTKSTPPYSYPRLVGVTEDEDVAVGKDGDPLKSAPRLVLEQVFVDLVRRAVHQPRPPATQFGAQVERADSAWTPLKQNGRL